MKKIYVETIEYGHDDYKGDIMVFNLREEITVVTSTDTLTKNRLYMYSSDFSLLANRLDEDNDGAFINGDGLKLDIVNKQWIWIK